MDVENRHVKKTSRLLDHSAVAQTPVPITEPCASCGVRCCNRFAVPITGFDVLRIIAATGKKTPEFAQLALAVNIESAPHTHVFIFENGKMEERLLTLHRLKNNFCAFSLHSAGCSIWGHHPLVCRTYPFVVDAKGNLKMTKNLVCPRKWEKNEFDEKKMKELGEQMNEEIFEYNKIVRKWNATRAKVGSEEDFFKFLNKESKEWMEKRE